TPKRTLQNAVLCLNAGDTLYIRAGTYTAGFVIYNIFGTASQPITISGYPGERPVIQPSVAWNNHGIITDATDWADSYLIVKDFDIDGINLPLDMDCMSINTNHNTIENIYCVNAARNGFKVFANHNTVRNNTIKNCGRIQPPYTEDTKGVG